MGYATRAVSSCGGDRGGDVRGVGARAEEVGRGGPGAGADGAQGVPRPGARAPPRPRRVQGRAAQHRPLPLQGPPLRFPSHFLSFSFFHFFTRPLLEIRVEIRCSFSVPYNAATTIEWMINSVMLRVYRFCVETCASPCLKILMDEGYGGFSVCCSQDGW